jgi:hypothetical protein
MPNFNGVLITDKQMQFLGFHVSPVLLRRGSVIEPGNFGRILGLGGANHNLHARERVLEEVRVAEFPNLPSRLNSAFYCATAEDADWFRRNHAVTNVIYSVVPLMPDLPVHIGYMNCLPSLDGMSDEEVARHYWRRDLVVQGPDRHPAREVLTTSPLLVLQNHGTLQPEQ